MGAEEKAKDYMNNLMMNLGYNCMSIYSNSDKMLEGKTVIFEEDFLNKVYEAYIAGYNEALEKVKDIKADYEVYKKSLQNGVKWHKVADGDLPDTDRTVLAITEIGGNPNYAYLASYREDMSLKWACWKNNMQREVVEPIAWCEIPRYEGE